MLNQAMRYLIFMPHPEPHEVPQIQELTVAVQLNLAATKLRMSNEAAAIKHATEALGSNPSAAAASKVVPCA